MWYRVLKKFGTKEELEKVLEDAEKRINLLDAMWENYLMEYEKDGAYISDYGIDDEKTQKKEIDIVSLKKYKDIIKTSKKGDAREMDFMSYVGVNRKYVINDKFVKLVGWKYGYDSNSKTVEIPNEKFLAWHILYIQEEDFTKLFRNSKSKTNRIQIEEDKNNILRFGLVLEKYNKYAQYGYVYEKLTGVNLALVFIFYYIKFREYYRKTLCSREYPDEAEDIVVTLAKMRDNIMEEKAENEKNIDKNFEKVRSMMKKILKAYVRIPYAYTRVYKANEFLFNIYCEWIIRCESYGQVGVKNELEEVLYRNASPYYLDSIGGKIDNKHWEKMHKEFMDKFEDREGVIESIEKSPKEDWIYIKNALNKEIEMETVYGEKRIEKERCFK